MNKSLPRSLDEIEFVPFVGREIDLNTKGKPSVYLRNVIIPYYRKVIRGLESDICKLRESKRNLLERKNGQIASKKWLTYKSNQKRYAVQEYKVRKKASELTERKFRRAALKQPLPMQSVLFYPIMMKAAKANVIRMEELVYILYGWNFMFLSAADYKQFFGDSFNQTYLNNCKKKGFIDVQKTKINQYYLSLKGKSLVKELIEEFNKLSNE